MELRKTFCTICSDESSGATSWWRSAVGSLMYSATPARKSRKPLKPSFFESLATIASDTPAPSATSLREVVSSKLFRSNTDSTTLTSRGVNDGSAMRILGPTALGSVPAIFLPHPRVTRSISYTIDHRGKYNDKAGPNRPIERGSALYDQRDRGLSIDMTRIAKHLCNLLLIAITLHTVFQVVNLEIIQAHIHR